MRCSVNGPQICIYTSVVVVVVVVDVLRSIVFFVPCCNDLRVCLQVLLSCSGGIGTRVT